MAKTYIAKRKTTYKGPPLRSISRGEYDYEFTPGEKEYSGIPGAIAKRIRAQYGDEFEVVETKRRSK